ncbi:MAG: hypothetical protein IB618_02295 [Candidatus Pacearchaeota archaeon]|nr:MAG: hypothetical protein IB618_02295 [Candidatus Pacearchaeota archaeon]
MTEPLSTFLLLFFLGNSNHELEARAHVPLVNKVTEIAQSVQEISVQENAGEIILNMGYRPSQYGIVEIHRIDTQKSLVIRSLEELNKVYRIFYPIPSDNKIVIGDLDPGIYNLEVSLLQKTWKSRREHFKIFYKFEEVVEVGSGETKKTDLTKKKLQTYRLKFDRKITTQIMKEDLRSRVGKKLTEISTRKIYESQLIDVGGEEYKKELIADGEKLNIEVYIPTYSISGSRGIGSGRVNESALFELVKDKEAVRIFFEVDGVSKTRNLYLYNQSWKWDHLGGYTYYRSFYTDIEINPFTLKISGGLGIEGKIDHGIFSTNLEFKRANGAFSFLIEQEKKGKVIIKKVNNKWMLGKYLDIRDGDVLDNRKWYLDY